MRHKRTTAVEMLDRINAIDERIANYSKTPKLGSDEIGRRLGVIEARLAKIDATDAEISAALRAVADALLDA